MNDLKDGGSSSGRSYVSCMKLHGVPLLPPLMTPECRQEMQYYRQLAVAVERRINDLRFCLDETTINSNILQSDSEEWCDGINISMVSSKNDYNNESFSDCLKYDCRTGNCNIQFGYAENNEFESMNSQLTVIDNDEHFSETKLESLSQNKNQSVEVTHGMGEQFLEANKNVPQPDILTNVNISEDYNSNSLKSSAQNKVLKDLSTVRDINFNTNTNNDQLKLAKNIITNVDSTKSINVHENLKNNASSSKNVKPLSISTKVKKNNSKKDVFVGVKNSFPIDSKSRISKNIEMLNLKKGQKKTTGMDNKSKLSPSKNVTGSLNNISSGLSSPPKLVRQNSYTLEYPSPLLLAHLEVQSLASGVELQSISMSDSTSTSHLPNAKQKNLDSNIAKEVWSSLGSDINSLSLNESSTVEKNNDVSDIKQVSVDLSCDKKILTKSEEIIPKYIIDQNSSKTSSIHDVIVVKTSESLPPNESLRYENDHLIDMSDDEYSQHTLSLDTLSKCENSNNLSLKYVLKKFEEEHAKRLAELVKKQKEEQLLLQKKFESQQKLLLAQFQSIRKSDNQISVSSKPISKNVMEKDNFYASENFEEKQWDISNTNNSKKISQCSDVLLHQNLQSPKMIKQPTVNTIINVNTTVIKPPSLGIDETNVMEKKKEADFSNKEKIHDFTKNKDNSICDFYDNIATSRSANTLDDINTTFASDDSISIPESKTNITPYYSNVTVREIDGMSKLKSAFDKITRIQQNLASKPSFKYSTELATNKTFYDDDCMSNKSQTVSLSSIGTLSQIYSEQDIHYPVMDRNSLSLNLVDISRPQSSRCQNFVKHQKITDREIKAATTIVAYAKGFLTRRLMRTEKVESIVQTIRDTLLCALQLYKDEKGIQGPDVDLHRRLIQQITAACYALHDMFIISTPFERMIIISQDRERKISLSYRSSSTTPSARQLSATTQKILKRKLEGMSKSHSGVFTTRSVSRPVTSNQMTRSHYDHDHSKSGIGYRPRRTITVAGEHGGSRKPWR